MKDRKDRFLVPAQLFPVRPFIHADLFIQRKEGCHHQHDADYREGKRAIKVKMLLLNKEDIRSVFTMSDAIEADKECYRLFSEGGFSRYLIRSKYVHFLVSLIEVFIVLQSVI